MFERRPFDLSLLDLEIQILAITFVKIRLSYA